MSNQVEISTEDREIIEELKTWQIYLNEGGYTPDYCKYMIEQTVNKIPSSEKYEEIKTIVTNELSKEYSWAK